MLFKEKEDNDWAALWEEYEDHKDKPPATQITMAIYKLSEQVMLLRHLFENQK